VTPLRVLVTGAAGQLGSVVVRTFADRQVVPHTSATLDVTDAEAVRQVVGETTPDVIINCAAFNDVDGAELRPREALAVNTFALRNLARAAETSGARLVHYSTDFVFDGRTDRPYVETDPPAPQSTYAASKLMGEWFALEAPRALVLRVESLFGTGRDWAGRRGTLDAIVDRLEAGQTVKVFTDRVVSPSHIDDIAAATRHLLETEADGGIFHCVNSGQATWAAVAAEAARLLGVAPTLEPITMSQFTTRAMRPKFCAMNPGRLEAAGFPMPSWQEALARWLAVRGRVGGAK